MKFPILIVASVFLGFIAGLAGYTFYYAKGTSYLSNRPEACTNCHVMQAEYDGWVKSNHHTVSTCNDCHMPSGFFSKYITKMLNGYHHSTAFTLMNFHEPIQIKEKNKDIVLNNCVRCHQDLTHDIKGLSAHQGKNTLDCLHCHAEVGHSR